jgi:septum formation topological specificity factor MinE
MSDAKERIKLKTIIAFLAGIIGVFASAYWTEVSQPSPGTFVNAAVNGLTTMSIAFMGIAIFSVLLDSKNWRDYFGERLKEVVIENSYLTTLDDIALKQLQTNILKVQFKNSQIDKDGSFLEYFHLHLHKFISEPYREDVSTEVLMNHSDDNIGYIVKDKVRYVCRASRGKIQKDVGWRPDEGEFLEVKSLNIKIQYPANHEKAGKIVDLEVDQTQLASGAKVLLSEYENIDGLVVITEAVYVVEKHKFQYWQMAHPTKNFDITITYPDNLEIQFKTLVLEDVVSQVTEDKGYLKFSYGTWALPQSGLAWLLKSATN